jgi:hypothetical protein
MKKLLSFTIGIASLLCFETTQAAKTVKTKVIHDNLGFPYTSSYIKESHQKTINNLNKQQDNRDITLVIFNNVYQNYKNWEILFKQGGGSSLLAYNTDSSFDNGGTVIGTLPEDTYDLWFTCIDNYWTDKVFDIQACWTDANNVWQYKRLTTNAHDNEILFSVPVTQNNIIYIDSWFW